MKFLQKREIYHLRIVTNLGVFRSSVQLMNFNVGRRLASTCVVLIFASLLVACGNSSTTLAQTPTATPTQPAPTPTSTSSVDNAFRLFTGSGFTVEYPTGWQKSQTKAPTGKTVYSFVYADQVTGFHVSLHTNFVDASSPITDLTGAQMTCNPGDTSLPPTITIHGALWYQSDMVCFLASTNFEVRMLTHTDATTKDQTTIVYGAYQQATASPPFAQANQKYFLPMLNSFRFI